MTTIVSGWASTADIDDHRTAIMPGAFDLDAKRIPILWRHKLGREIGDIIHLSYRDEGLWIVASVEDDALAEQARGFSIAAGIEEYEMRNKGTAHYHAVVHKARLYEISLVLNPANGLCKIVERRKIDTRAFDEFHATAQRAIALLADAVQLLKKGIQS